MASGLTRESALQELDALDSALQARERCTNKSCIVSFQVATDAQKAKHQLSYLAQKRRKDSVNVETGIRISKADFQLSTISLGRHPIASDEVVVYADAVPSQVLMIETIADTAWYHAHIVHNDTTTVEIRISECLGDTFVQIKNNGNTFSSNLNDEGWVAQVVGNEIVLRCSRTAHFSRFVIGSEGDTTGTQIASTSLGTTFTLGAVQGLYVVETNDGNVVDLTNVFANNLETTIVGSILQGSDCAHPVRVYNSNPDDSDCIPTLSGGIDKTFNNVVYKCLGSDTMLTLLLQAECTGKLLSLECGRHGAMGGTNALFVNLSTTPTTAIPTTAPTETSTLVDSNASDGNNKKTIAIISGSAVGVGILGFGAFFAFKKYQAKARMQLSAREATFPI